MNGFEGVDVDTLVILLAVGVVIVAFRFFNRSRAKRYLMSNPGTVEVSSIEELDELFAESSAETSILFLHDPWCPISGAAARQVSELEDVVHLIDVSRQHELSRAVETRTGVRHESPQLFVIKRGKQIWNASHYGIQARDIQALLSTSGEQPG